MLLRQELFDRSSARLTDAASASASPARNGVKTDKSMLPVSWPTALRRCSNVTQSLPLHMQFFSDQLRSVSQLAWLQPMLSLRCFSGAGAATGLDALSQRCSSGWQKKLSRQQFQRQPGIRTYETARQSAQRASSVTIQSCLSTGMQVSSLTGLSLLSGLRQGAHFPKSVHKGYRGPKLQLRSFAAGGVLS